MLTQQSQKNQSDQLIHCKISYNSRSFLATFCYGRNEATDRERMWNLLMSISRSSFGPWIILRDFNTVHWGHEKQGGAAPDQNSMNSFNNCIDACGLMDPQLTGPNFSWSNSSFGDKRVECKVDRALINCHFHFFCQDLKGSLLMPGLSDHYSTLIS